MEPGNLYAQPRPPIEFLHPIDPDGGSILLRLPALDLGIDPSASPSQSSAGLQKKPAWGLDYETARVACGILADNRWDGYFTSVESGKRVEDTTKLLVEPRYFFNVPVADSNDNGDDGIGKYAVVRDFASWRFPHNNLPPRWRFSIPGAGHQDSHSRSRTRHSRLEPNQSCIITTSCQAVQNAHIIPSAHTEWFDINNMTNYLLTTSPDINSVANRLPLRSDVHTLMDDGRFCIVPKAVVPNANLTSAARDATHEIPVYHTPGSGPDVHLILHVLRPDFADELFTQYHNVSLQSLKGRKPQYLLAAFAEKVFELCRYFRNDGVARQAMQVVVEDGGSRTYKVNPVVLLPRTKSPTKKDGPTRKRTRTEDDDACDGTDSEETEDYACGDVFKKRKRDSSPASEERGRTLRRPSNIRTSSTVTSAGARTPSASGNNDRHHRGKYSYHVSLTAPTKEEAWENEDVWRSRQRRWQEL
ncbi:hypothetical protein F5B21DRAFT_473105 [Xylaria acuta]|nr:hypothetical protein F5B21DRAFT_473105 [Xylaria acuta]